MATRSTPSEVEALARAVRRGLEAAAGTRRLRTVREYSMGPYRELGLSVPEYRSAMKPFHAPIRALTLGRRLDLAALLLGAHVGELGHAGIFALAQCAGELEPRQFRRLDRALDDFRGWSHVDDFCGYVMPAVLERHRRETVALFGRWSRSPNLWKRRASVVTFVRKVAATGAHVDDVLRLCDRLVDDPEDLVRKGVGWALKDNLRAEPERVIAYVKDLRRRGVSATITLYAIRDLRGPLRREVLAVKPERAPRARSRVTT